MSKSLGVALKAYLGSVVHVTMDQKTIVPVEVQDPSGKKTSVPMEMPISFQATSYREVEPDSDVWEFRVKEQDAKGNEAWTLVCFRGDDVRQVRTLPKLVGG